MRVSAQATAGRPGTHARAFPTEIQARIPDLRFAPSGMTAYLRQDEGQPALQLRDRPAARNSDGVRPKRRLNCRLNDDAF
jgi:hypothetical protein